MGFSIETGDVVKKVLLEMLPALNEKERRMLCSSFASALGFGGTSFVSEISGLCRNTIVSSRVRDFGGGRKKNSALLEALSGLCSGSSSDVLSYCCTSLVKLCKVLEADFGICVSKNSVSRALEALGYNKRVKRGPCFVESPLQFDFINDKGKEFLSLGFPVVFISGVCSLSFLASCVFQWCSALGLSFNKVLIICSDDRYNSLLCSFSSYYNVEVHVCILPMGSYRFNLIKKSVCLDDFSISFMFNESVDVSLDLSFSASCSSSPSSFSLDFCGYNNYVIRPSN